jgi:hypothetical protein
MGYLYERGISRRKWLKTLTKDLNVDKFLLENFIYYHPHSDISKELPKKS